MMQITEDTPPDMLAGAMDLTVHLPNGKSVKTSVERSTPMMDLLVQITTANHLQLSNHTLQVLGMAPSSEYSDKVLPFKPNTPIGTLDTQHIRVLPKGKTIPQSKYVAPPGHQPFESTFRLKVHLPRNQLYVTRVSRNVLLEDIMKKVCEEKKLDPLKYDFKHPGNLDQVLDPKLTLSDYQITEIYVVAKGTTNLSQAFSAADIMVLRKEEERKQMHNKTGGGVFNLIFKRGKSSMGSGSVSSNDNRSISPTQSDDSRSVTPPAPPPPKKELPLERPKPPQRKRRPAPRPPQANGSSKENLSTDQANESIFHDTNEEKGSQSENGLTICHSRNSSDSSGYHEASILSEHGANASLPRNRPKSTAFGGDMSQGTSNLTKMASHSRSTTSLVAGRKKKAAPPPPPSITVSPASSVVAHTGPPSPLVASQPEICPRTEFPEVLETIPSAKLVPVPKPRKKPPKAPPRSRPVSLYETERERIEAELGIEPINFQGAPISEHMEPLVDLKGEDLRRTLQSGEPQEPSKTHLNKIDPVLIDVESLISVDAELRPEVGQQLKTEKNISEDPTQEKQQSQKSSDYSMEEILASLEMVKPFIMKTEAQPTSPTSPQSMDSPQIPKIMNIQKSAIEDIFTSKEFLKEFKPPEVVGMIPKAAKERDNNDLSLRVEVVKDEMIDIDESLFAKNETPSIETHEVFNQRFGIHDYDPAESPTRSLRSSTCSIPGLNSTAMRKWDNLEELDHIAGASSDVRSKWVAAGDVSETESIPTTLPSQLDSAPSETEEVPSKPNAQEEKSLESTDSGIAQDPKESEDDSGFRSPPPPPILDDIVLPNDVLTPAEHIPLVREETPKEPVDVTEWEYQLPSPPKAFRDSSPQDTLLETISLGGNSDFKDSVVTSPELFEKLRTLEDKESITGEEPPLNTLSLEHLEKRKSLVYNRELATSFKMTDSIEPRHSENTAAMANFQKPTDRPRTAHQHNNILPNFKITTYDVPKHQNIKVFEDDTVRSNENVSFIKRNSVDLNNVGPSKDYVFYKPQAVSRSGSFSTEVNKTTTKPVSRSRSTLTLNKYQPIVKKEDVAVDMSRSSSLYDVSGLHSLEVIKMIRNKLNTPSSSVENLHQPSQGPPAAKQSQKAVVAVEETPKETLCESQPVAVEPKSPSPEPVKKYYYRGPPAVNMSTWSERPKVPVAVKEDEDYKLGNVNNNSATMQKAEITQNSGNVVIKIGPATNSTRLLAPAAYRKPLGNLNGVSQSQRPHSIAFDSSFDVNRVPVVRSVEFKKPYKDFHVNTTITHLNQADSLVESTPQNNFKIPNSQPIVRGFNSNRLSWQATSGGGFDTLPTTKPKEEHYVPNQHVPFSQSTLRRTESSKRYISDQNSNIVNLGESNIGNLNNSNSYSSLPSAPNKTKVSVSAAPPPPPPEMPALAVKKVVPQKRNQSNDNGVPRDMLMESIRNFGGKKGLRTAKT